MLAAQGLLPLPAEQLLALQLYLVAQGEPAVAERAGRSLAEADARSVSRYIASDAGEDELRYFAHQHASPLILEAVLRRREVPRDLLVELAPRLSTALQEVLILRQDAILDEPAILDALEANPQLARDVRRRLGEYRQHLVRRRLERVVAPEAAQELSAEELLAFALVERLPKEGEVDEITGLSEGQIRALPVPVRIKLARGATKTLRSILIKDLNSQVALSVLDRSPMTDDELEQTANSRQVVDEVLVAISKRREWVARYRIALALAKNPKTPIAVAVRMVARLSIRDMRLLAADRNVADAVRSAANRLYRIKVR